MNHLFEPVEDEILSHRSPTKASRYGEKLLMSFLECGAPTAKVKVEDTPYGIDELYETCRRVCRKNFFSKKVSVSKNDGRLLFIRKD